MKIESKPIWLIVPSEERAVILRIVGNEITPFVAVSDETTTLAGAIAKTFSEQEYDAQPILLAPRSADVLSVTLPPDSSANRQAMIYELEEFFPIPAEQFVADVAAHERGRFAGVIDTEKFMPLLDELVTQKILVQAIVPLSILIVQYLTHHPMPLDGSICAIVWSYGEKLAFDEEKIELFLVTPDGLPLSWQLLDANPESLRRAIEAEIFTKDVNLSVDPLYLPENLRTLLEKIPRVSVAAEEQKNDEEPDSLLLRALAKQSELVLSRKKRPWWNFCRDQLAMRGTDRVLGKSVRMLLWGSVALVAALCLVCFVRMFQYDRLAYQYRQEQEKVFREALPEQTLQTGFRNRLESEYVKMSAQRENTADLPERESVLIPLLNVLQSLPKNVRYRFPEIRIEQNTLRLDGQLQVHGDAELIATALERGGFAVEPPSTQQTGSSGVSVRLSIVRPSKEGRK
jgi:type II secretory pathway component PulL